MDSRARGRRPLRSRIRRAGESGTLFEAAFNYVHFHRYGELATRRGLEVVEARFHGDTNLPLMTDFIQDPASGRIELSIAFDPSRYSLSFAEAMVARYLTALAALTTAPDLPHTASDLLSAAERARLADAGRGSRPDMPVQALVPRLAAALAEHRNRTAVETAGKRLSYSELAHTARDFGAGARRALTGSRPGCGDEPTVALLLPRGTDLVTAAVGCLLAGVPFVVCDPAQGPERLRDMLADARAGLVVAAEPQRQAAALPPGVPCRTPQELGADGGSGPDAEPRPGDLAYLVFTSGSSGRPKPVAVPHGALANRLDWSQRAYPLRPDDRVLALAAPVFDFAVWEMLAPLLSGASVITAPDLKESTAGLGALLRETGSTVAHLVPSLIGGLLDEPGPADGSALRLLLVGGEAFPARLLEELRAALPCEVIHQYGPAEAAIDATFHRATAASAPAGGSGTVPIGRPIDNVVVHLLGDNLLPVPPGCAGELFIGGEATARGYHSQPGRTAGAFLPDPNAGMPGARMYRTGDLARLLPDGSLEFLGRTDDQIQVNGVRVEPGEIEAALLAGGLLAEAAVVARATDHGGTRLVAHVVPRDGVPFSADEVLAGLAGLPEALHPSLAVAHAELPRTSSGKVDRLSLRTAELPEQPRGPRAAAATELEERLGALWSQVLGAPGLGVEDDFFVLGGDSIAALQLVARARRDGIAMTARSLYANRTVRALARSLAPARPSADGPRERSRGPALVALRGDGGGAPFFCVHASNGSAAPYVPLAGALSRPRPFFGLDAEGLSPDGPELASVPALAAHYLAQVRAEQPQGRPYLLGGWSTGAAVAFEMAAQLRADGERVAALVLFDPAAPPALDAPPESAELLWLFLRDLAGLAGRPVPPLAVEDLRGLGPDTQQEAVLRTVRTAGLVPDDVLEEVATRLGLFRSLVSAAAVWRPGAYDGPLTVLTAGAGDPAERIAAWRCLTTGAFEARPVDGDHHGMLRRPAVDGLAALLERCLEGLPLGMGEGGGSAG
ncbi:amino acid adenylation domain-containing protein [Streptomyces sp. NPDC001792]|uniref:amino acid adenylation domain-containing protein n=1 Tax=Streptomyces sp. NPDC001792 TaxID=3154524 RepID=UPI00331A65DE